MNLTVDVLKLFLALRLGT